MNQDLGNVYQVKFKYQVAAQLGETAWAGWDSAKPQSCQMECR